MKQSELIRGDVVSFNIVATGIMPESYKELVLQDRLSANTARLLAAVDAMHSQIAPALPNKHLRPDDYDWLVFTPTHGGNNIVIGSAWIKENTITSLTTKTAVLKVYRQDSNILVLLREMALSNNIAASDMEIYFQE